MGSSRPRVIDDYKRQEYEEKRGRGVIKLLSDLQWIRNAELDNDKPYEEERILLRKRIFFMGAGASLAVSLHFGLSVIFFTFSVLFGLLSPTAGEIYAVFAAIAKTVLLIFFPVWLIEKYHVWDKGITKLLLKDVIFWGYVPAILLLIVVSGISNLLITAVLNGFLALKKEWVLWIHHHLPFLFSYWSLLEYPVQLLLVITVPAFWMWKKDKENRFTVKPYTLLDEIPEEK